MYAIYANIFTRTYVYTCIHSINRMHAALVSLRLAGPSANLKYMAGAKLDNYDMQFNFKRALYTLYLRYGKDKSRKVSHFVAACCGVLQCVAVCCSVLRCVTLSINVSRHRIEV